MMKIIRAIFIFLCLTILIIPATAQDEVELPESFSAIFDVVRFNHPINWEVNIVDEREIIRLSPDLNVLRSQSGVYMEFDFHRAEFYYSFTDITDDMSVGERLMAIMDDLVHESEIIFDDEPIISNTGRYDMATINVRDLERRFIMSLVDTGNADVLVELTVPKDTITLYEPVYYEVLGTFEYNPVDVSETIAINTNYNDEISGLSFSYLGGWVLDDSFSIILLESVNYLFHDIEQARIFLITLDDGREIYEMVSEDMSAEEGLQAIIDAFANNDIEYGDIEIITNEDSTIASSRIRTDYERGSVQSVVETENGLVIVSLDALEEDIDLVQDLYFDVVETINLEALEPEIWTISETFTNSDETLSFNYPEDWEVEEIRQTMYFLTPSTDPFDRGWLRFEFNIRDEDYLERRDLSPYITSEEFLLHSIEYIFGPEQTFVENIDDITISEYEGTTVASVQIYYDENSLINAIIETADGFILAQVAGSKARVDGIRDLFWEILNQSHRIKSSPLICHYPSPILVRMKIYTLIIPKIG